MPISLYSHQEEALEKLKTGSILMGGVGTGKSRTALAYYIQQCGGRYFGENLHLTIPKHLYIITTAKKRDSYEWQNECMELNIPIDSVTVDSWNNISKYVEVRDSFFIFDEQRVVGYGAWTKSFLKITRNNNEWILLSATPGDTWMDYIPVFIANGFYKNKTEFVRRHCVFNRYSKYPKIDRFMEEGRLQKLRKSILVDMPYVKHTKSIVRDIVVDYDKEAMDMVVKSRWNAFEERPIKNVSELCQLMRRVSNTDYERMAKISDILEEKQKVIIFYNYDYELEILRTLCSLPGYTIAEWNGHKHDSVPRTDKWVYLVQYNAGCEGWNCITTDTIIFYSLNYSYRMMCQAAGRIDRMNTPFQNLYYYCIFSKSPIDKAILRALKNKKNFNAKSFADW